MAAEHWMMGGKSSSSQKLVTAKQGQKGDKKVHQD
jgi:hypothetical protein